MSRNLSAVHGARAIGLVVITAFFSGCATAPAPEAPSPVVGPKIEVSLEEIQERYLPKIEENLQLIDRQEAEKAAVVTEQKARLERLRARYRATVEKIDAASATITLLDEQIPATEARLAEVRASEATLPSTVEELESELASLREDRAAESSGLAELDRQAGELRRAEEGLAALDDEGLFRVALEGIYRDTLSLYRAYYQEVFTLARDRFAGREAALVGELEERVGELEERLTQPLVSEGFRRQRQRFARDTVMHSMWLAVYILDVRFPVGGSDLNAIDPDERRRLEELTQILAETLASEGALEVFIDGHADRRKFAGRQECVSATLNKDLSRDRADAVRAHLEDAVPDLSGRIEVDWYGNFNLLATTAGDALGNRRIELRVALEGQGGRRAHAEYFGLRDGLALAEARLAHSDGRWTTTACAEADPDQLPWVEHLSEEHRKLLARLDLDGEREIEVDGRGLRIALGNDAIVQDRDGSCVRIVPCAAEDRDRRER